MQCVIYQAYMHVQLFARIISYELRFACPLPCLLGEHVAARQAIGYILAGPMPVLIWHKIKAGVIAS